MRGHLKVDKYLQLEPGLGTQEVYRITDHEVHRPAFESLQAKVQDYELTNEYWHENAKKVVEDQLRKQPNTNKAKNIIFFLGDGMSFASVGKLLLI